MLEVTEVFEENWNAIHAVNPDGSRKYRYIINEGSSRSSKTFSLIDCCDLYARSYENKRITVWRDTKTDCKDTVLVDVLFRLKSTNRYKVDQTFNKTESKFGYSNDSSFEIHGTDEENKVMGLGQDVAWFNEPYKISKGVFDQVDQRTKDFVIIDWNPKMGHFIDDLKKDKRAIVIHSTFKKNPFCPPEQKAKILSYQPLSMCEAVELKLLTENDARQYNTETNILNLSQQQIAEIILCKENEFKRSADPYKWSVYGLGLKAEKPNRIFKWNKISLSDYQKINTPLYYGSDWGSVDPWAILESKYLDGNLYLRELNYDSENIIRAKIKPSELEIIRSKDEGIVTWMFGKLGIPFSRPIVCDSNRPLKVTALRRSGWEYAISAIKPTGSKIDGIDLLNNLNVYYVEGGANIENEQENYSRKVDRYGVVLEEPEDFDDHCMDAARYIALYLEQEGIIRKV